MNERIKELARKNADYWMNHYDRKSLADMELLHKDVEKFADLIVRECSGIAYEYDIPNLTGPGEFIGNRIKKHFGVEE